MEVLTGTQAAEVVKLLQHLEKQNVSMLSVSSSACDWPCQTRIWQRKHASMRLKAFLAVRKETAHQKFCNETHKVVLRQSGELHQYLVHHMNVDPARGLL